MPSIDQLNKTTALDPDDEIVVFRFTDRATRKATVQTFADWLNQESAAALAATDGASKVGYGSRTVQNKLDDVVSVKDKGAVGDGIANDLPAFAAAYAAAPAGGRIRIPAGSYASVSGALTGTKFVIWEASGQPAAGGIWSLPGLVEQAYTTRRVSAIEQTVPNDDNKHSFVRDASHTGGTPGFVCANVSVNTKAGALNTNFEWGFLSVLDNSAASGENVAVYGQGNKLAGGPTWAACFEAIDKTNAADPTTGLVAVEVDVRANGTDANNNRLGLDIVVGKATAGGTAPEAYAALRTSYATGAAGSGEWLHALVINSAKSIGIRMRQSGKVGVDFSEATFSDTVPNMAVRLAAGQRINFSAADTRTLRYEPATTALRYATGTTTLFEIADDGTLRASGQITVNGTKVIGSRDTGWTAMTGTTNKATAYATSTITLQQLAERVAALQAALAAHGLVGT